MVEIGSVLAELLLEESYSALEHIKQVGNWETITNARTIVHHAGCPCEDGGDDCNPIGECHCNGELLLQQDCKYAR